MTTVLRVALPAMMLIAAHPGAPQELAGLLNEEPAEWKKTVDGAGIGPK